VTAHSAIRDAQNSLACGAMVAAAETHGGSGGSASAAPSGAVEFPAVYDDNVAFVWRTLRALGVPEHLVEDAVQETFAVVARRRGDFEGRASVRTWLFAIIRRVASHHRRHQARKGSPEHLSDTVLDSLADRQQASPRDEAERLQAVRILSRLLDTLKDEKRAVFVLVDLEGMTLPETAEALGVKLGTVASRLRVARAIFERAVAKHLAQQAKQDKEQQP